MAPQILKFLIYKSIIDKNNPKFKLNLGLTKWV